MNFENLQIEEQTLPDFEDSEMEPISSKYGYIIALNLLIGTVIFFTAIVIFYYLKPEFFSGYFPSVLGIFIFFALFTFIINYFEFFTKKYALRAHDIMYQSGIIKKSTMVIPFNRIQHVDMEEGWLSRSLDIKSIIIYTAGQGGGDMKINGLQKDVSEKIYQFILNKIKAEKTAQEETATEIVPASVDIEINSVEQTEPENAADV